MLTSFMGKHFLTEGAMPGEIDITSNVTGGNGAMLGNEILNNYNLPKDELEELIDTLEDDLNDMDQEEEVSPLMEQAVEFSTLVDELYLLQENIVVKTRIKGAQLSALLEDSSTPLLGKGDAKEGAIKLIAGAAKNLLNAIMEKLNQLIAGFTKFISGLFDRASMFLNKLTGWSTGTAQKILELAKANPDKIGNYPYTRHMWALGGVDIEKMISVVDELIPQTVTDDADAEAKLADYEKKGWTPEDVKRKLLKAVNLNMDNGGTVEGIVKLLSGETDPFTGVTVSDISKWIDVVKQYDGNVKKSIASIKTEVMGKLEKALAATKAQMGKNCSTVQAQYFGKRVSNIMQAIAMVNMITTAKFKAEQDCALEYIRLVNGVGKHINKSIKSQPAPKTKETGLVAGDDGKK